MIVQLQADLYQIREALVCSYVLLEDDEICLIDTGFISGLKSIQTCLHRMGLSWRKVSTILITHGHLDHTYNLAAVHRRSGAVSYAHPLDSEHIAARYAYRGKNRICGFLEFCGRALFGYSITKIDRALSDNQTIPFGSGIRVVHTPGHTAGHCSFHWLKHDILFTGDLFATGHRRTFLPPSFLNSCPELFSPSIQRVLDLTPAGILSNHCDKASAQLQRQRFERLALRQCRALARD